MRDRPCKSPANFTNPWWPQINETLFWAIKFMFIKLYNFCIIARLQNTQTLAIFNLRNKISFRNLSYRGWVKLALRLADQERKEGVYNSSDPIKDKKTVNMVTTTKTEKKIPSCQQDKSQTIYIYNQQPFILQTEVRLLRLNINRLGNSQMIIWMLSANYNYNEKIPGKRRCTSLIIH